MAATFFVTLPQALVVDAGGLAEGDLIRYVNAEPPRDVALVVEALEIKSTELNEFLLIRCGVRPESRAGEATVEVQVGPTEPFFIGQ